MTFSFLGFGLSFFHVFRKRELCSYAMFVTCYSTRLEDEVICWIFSWFYRCTFFGSWGFSVSKNPPKSKALTQGFAVWMTKWAAKKYLFFLGVLSAGLYYPCRVCDKSHSEDPYSVSSIVKCNMRVVAQSPQVDHSPQLYFNALSLKLTVRTWKWTQYQNMMLLMEEILLTSWGR